MRKRNEVLVLDDSVLVHNIQVLLSKFLVLLCSMKYTILNFALCTFSIAFEGAFTTVNASIHMWHVVHKVYLVMLKSSITFVKIGSCGDETRF